MSDLLFESNTDPRILVVDDDQSIQILLKIQLENAGFIVTLCSNGQDAIDSINQDPPDLVLLDVMMPGVSGFDVLESVRQTAELDDLPIIILTALPDNKDVLRGLELGANDYQTKPFAGEELIARINTFVKIKRLQDQRREDIKKLQELSILKDKFVTIASHDIKGGLGTIKAGLQLIEEYNSPESADPSSTDKVISAMSGAVNMMETIVEDFLDIQAIKAGAIKLDMKLISLNDSVEGAIEQYRPRAEMKDITLLTELSPMLPNCMADPQRIAQVMGNLLGNAIKYSPTGATVVMRTLARDEVVRIEVEDSGIGIHEEELPLIFQEYAGLQNRPTGNERSDGVGLSITSGLIDIHGGYAGVESTPGIGSLFWFELPIGDGENERENIEFSASR